MTTGTTSLWAHYSTTVLVPLITVFLFEGGGTLDVVEKHAKATLERVREEHP